MLAFSRMPGNAFSFWIRRTLRWSRGRPVLPHEPKQDLFAYLDGAIRKQAADREADLRERYRLEPLARESTRALYRKNLYLIDILEEAARGLPIPVPSAILPALSALSALDVGSQDWHYVFGLERWLRHGGGGDRRVSLRGVEVDGYGIYPDFRSRKDYAGAYAAQTGNPEVTYEVGDILDAAGSGLDLVTVFYPFVTRHHLLLWGLPLRLFSPARLAAKAASLLRTGGWLLVFTHTLKEHEAFLALGKGTGALELVKQGRALSNLVDFHEDVEDRRYSVWKRV
jgi:hypothetical protein